MLYMLYIYIVGNIMHWLNNYNDKLKKSKIHFTVIYHYFYQIKLTDGGYSGIKQCTFRLRNSTLRTNATTAVQYFVMHGLAVGELKIIIMSLRADFPNLL